MDWLSKTEEATKLYAERVIDRDSDGNPCRVRFEPEAIEKIARRMEDVAPECYGRHAVVSTFVDELKKYAIPVRSDNLKIS